MIKEMDNVLDSRKELVSETHHAVNKNEPIIFYHFLKNTTQEIIVLAPIIDEQLTRTIALANRDQVKIKLLFSSIIQNKRVKILKKLIHQHKLVNTTKKLQRDKQSFQLLLFAVLFITLAIGSMGYFISQLSNKINILGSIFYLLIGITALIIGLWFWKRKVNEDNTEVYAYQYIENLDFKFLENYPLDSKYNDKIVLIIDQKEIYTMPINQDLSQPLPITRLEITEDSQDILTKIKQLLHYSSNTNSYQTVALGKEVYQEVKF